MCLYTCIIWYIIVFYYLNSHKGTVNFSFSISSRDHCLLDNLSKFNEHGVLTISYENFVDFSISSSMNLKKPVGLNKVIVHTTLQNNCRNQLEFKPLPLKKNRQFRVIYPPGKGRGVTGFVLFEFQRQKSYQTKHVYNVYNVFSSSTPCLYLGPRLQFSCTRTIRYTTPN